MNSKSKIYKVFSTPFVILNYLKSSKWDNFMGGLVFGAIFSLIVNLVTFQVQETIQKQRVLEAVESEIVDNAIRANNVISGGLKKNKDNSKINYYETFPYYSDAVWGTSEGLKYIVQLPAETQIKVGSYYKFGIVEYNKIIKKDNDLLSDKLASCYFDFENKLKPDEIQFCNDLYHALLQNQIKTAEVVGKDSFELLKIFHPTKDRLNNFFLKLMMGGSAPKILST